MKRAKICHLRTYDLPRFKLQVRLALVVHKTIPAAAAALGVTRQALNAWLRKYPGICKGLRFRGSGRPLGTKNKPRTRFYFTHDD